MGWQGQREFDERGACGTTVRGADPAPRLTGGAHATTTGDDSATASDAASPSTSPSRTRATRRSSPRRSGVKPARRAYG